ncbi:alpha/beta fold hydrolase [Kutzneria albida]|uniref:AB hydrolase-1 domain-containing protein n=1 Tax=Kutzneria albida DSM 43870 TaxID=1449976 RepID=W5WKT0_9PSEU|nr:alpha/beta hydrolase [Kutzneria albida]AHI01814.1 hypothetical protein KALB_8457 [Kutzneria albida DSM 43870]
MGKIVANGIRTHFQRMPARCADARSAPTVVFIHGLGTDSLASFYLTLAAPVAAAGINMIAYDLRGHGRTDRPATGYRVGDFVDDLAALLDELDVEGPVHLVGNSFGGTVAFSYALAHPHRVASIISIEAEPATEGWGSRMSQLLRYLAHEMTKESTFADIEAKSGAHHAKLARNAADKFHTTSIVDDLPTGPLMSVPELMSIRCPVMSVLGSEGLQAGDPHLLGSVLHNCRTVILQGQDHSVLVDAHRRVRELLIPWVLGMHSEIPWLYEAAEAAALGTAPAVLADNVA